MRRGILAGISLKGEERRFEGKLEECRALCEACGIEVVDTIIQRSRSIDPRMAFRAGKVQELTAAVKGLDAELVVFSMDLSAGMISRLTEETGAAVIDRTGLILEIFSQRARSRQAKLQVELAKLNYALSSRTDHSQQEDHARGGSFRSRGAGEGRTAGTLRTSRKRIAVIRRELDDLEHHYRVAENRRGKSALGRCALVGYTNAGKSSLMNAILSLEKGMDRQVYAADQLFATLDSSVRNAGFGTRRFLLYDTVGFVSDLPHTLIEAFKSTLDSARNADLLLNVVDASDPERDEKAQVALDTLAEIGAGGIRVLTVYTKCDLLNEPGPEGGILVSSKTNEGIETLLAQICDTLYPAEVTLLCDLPYEEQPLLHELQKTVKITILNEHENGILLKASGPSARLEPLERYMKI